MSTSTQQYKLQDLTVAGGLDYLMDKLAVAKDEQDQTGWTIRAKQTNKLLEGVSTESLDCPSRSSGASTTFTSHINTSSESFARRG